MEVNSAEIPQLQFGKIDSKYFDGFASNDCIEFPPSWPLEDRGAQHCSNFTFSAVEAQNTLPVKNVASGTKALKLQEPQCSILLKEVGKHNPSKQAFQNAEESEKTGQNDLECDIIGFDVDEGGIESTKVASEISNNASGNDRSEKSSHESIVAEVVTSVDEEKTSAKREHDKENVEVPATKEQTNDNCKSNTEQKSQKIRPSWASLLRNNEGPVASAQTTSQCDKLQQRKYISMAEQKNKKLNPLKTEVTTEEKSANSVVVVKPDKDPKAGLYAEKLLHINLVFKPQAFIPRGFINTSNWCYINATLQALLACPPFIQMLKCLPFINPSQRMETSTPIMDSFLQLASEFRPMSAKRNQQPNKEVKQGPPFEPSYVYKMLATIKSTLSERGSQEDAEEFLSCVLNGIHEEMTQLLQHYDKNTNRLLTDSDTGKNDEVEYVNGLNSCYDTENANDDNMNDWEEVVKLKRNRSAITRRVDVSNTLISRIFRGELCTTVFRSGKKASASYEPFFCIPLHVPSDQASSLEDAMLALTKKESFTEKDSDSDASRQQTINILPPVLILHLKRFVYDKNGGTKKIDKQIEFKTDLIISKELLLKSSKKHSLSQRSYKLFAVVYHHGEKVTGGHYTTDVFHIGLGSWLRMDDRNIWAIPHTEVTRHNSIRTPYILYYRRTDFG